jgi:hypothetical protein
MDHLQKKFEPHLYLMTFLCLGPKIKKYAFFSHKIP